MEVKKNGMLIALMDEYRRATIAYKALFTEMSTEVFEKIRDEQTSDPDCRSIQTVSTHVVQSGYTYANYINGITGGEWLEYQEQMETPQAAVTELDKMLDYTETVFADKWSKPQKEIESWHFDTRWNVRYDFEQLMEHAIVHILRHRRQIENFLNQEKV